MVPTPGGKFAMIPVFKNTLPIYSPHYYPYNINVRMPQMAPFVDPNVSSLINKLQTTILEQQLIIKNLLSRASYNEPRLEELPNFNLALVKVEENGESETSRHTSPITDHNCSETLEKNSFEDQAVSRASLTTIIRRNGFKKSVNFDYIKEKSEDREDEEENSSNDSHSTQPDPLINRRRKSSNNNINTKNLSKAKHLWVNYGRRILEHAAGEIGGVMQDRLKHLVGKLNSKKDFERTFQIKENDSEEDKEFKTVLGKTAIDFVRNKAFSTFKNSKYKQEMITQRHSVSAWIERLISS